MYKDLTPRSYEGGSLGGGWNCCVQGSDTLNSYTVITWVNGSWNSLLLMSFSYDS